LPPVAGRSPEEEALTGNCNPARAAAVPTAVALALCGTATQIAQALKQAESLAAKRPEDMQLNAIDLPMLRAVAMPGNAIEFLRPVTHYERLRPEVVYLRGLSYLRLRKGDEAAAEFQKIVDHKGANWGPFYAVAYVGLARGAALAGDTSRAKKAYQD